LVKKQISNNNNFKVIFNNLNHSFLDIIQNAIWAGQKAENEFEVPWKQEKSRFIGFNQVVFRLVQRPKIIWKCHAGSWNNAFSS